MLSVHPIIILLLLLIVLLNHNQTVWAQQLSFGQDPFEIQRVPKQQNRLDTIIKLLQQSRQGSIIQLNLTIIVFMMGLAFVIFGSVHWTGTKTFCLYEETLPDCLFCTYCSYHSYTLTIYSYMLLLSGAFEDPVLTVAFLLLIPVTASYVLMIVKSRHEFVQRS